MLWTQEKLKIAQDILGKYTSFDYAHEQLQNAIGKVSKSSVRNAFHAAGLKSPTKFLRGHTPLRVEPASSVFTAIADRAIRAGEFVRAATEKRSSFSTSRIIVISDMHIPYHDVRAWNCMLETIRGTVNPTVVIIGDFADCYSVSSHPKSLDRKADFAGEISAVNSELDELRRAAPAARIIYCAGNHEDRIERYLQGKAPELAGFAGMRSDGLLRAKERGIEWVPYRRHIKIGNCSFTHDLGRSGVNCARQSLLDFGGNIVVGHSHRGGVSYQGEAKGSSHFCLNVGWGGNVEDIDYVHRVRSIRDWQCGFGIVDQDETGYSWASFIPIIDGRCIVDGKIVSGRKAAA